MSAKQLSASDGKLSIETVLYKLSRHCLVQFVTSFHLSHSFGPNHYANKL